MYRMSRGGQRPGLEVLTGDSAEIRKYVYLELYDLIWYQDNREEIYNPCIGRWLGVYHQVRSALCYCILTDKGTVLSHTTVQHVTIYDIKDPNIAENFKDYTDTMYGNLSYLKYIYTECDF